MGNTNSSFYVDGDNSTTGVVTSNDNPNPPTGNTAAPSSFYQGGAGNQYATLQNADTLSAEFDADLAAAQAAQAAAASSASSASTSASSAAASLATFLASGATSAPLMDGVAAVGTSNLWVRQDHVHPTDTTRAPLASPALTGTPTAPTAGAQTNSTQLATTAYVDAKEGNATPLVDGTAAVGTSHLFARQDHVHPTDTTRAPLASPALTGTPTAPTAAVDTSTTQLASTAFVLGQASSAGDGTPAMDGTAARGTSTHFARADHVHPTDTSRAPLASPALTGTPTAPTPATADNSTALATTAYVKANLTASGVASFNSRTGVVLPVSGDYTFAQIGSTPTSVGGYGITDAVKTTGNQNITGGFTVSAASQAAGSFTCNPATGNYQFFTNNAALTITAPSSDCAIDYLMTNGATAGAVTFSGFTVGASTGDALTTTNTSKFLISIRRINGVATYMIKALQ